MTERLDIIVISPSECLQTPAGFAVSDDLTPAELDEARRWALIAVKRATLQGNPANLAATKRYLERLERKSRR